MGLFGRKKDEDDVWIHSEDQGERFFITWGNGKETLGSEYVSREDYYKEPSERKSIFNYDDDDESSSCSRGCGGDWPNCKYTCPLYDNDDD